MSQSNSFRKLFAPIVITVLVCVGIVGQFFVFSWFPEIPLWALLLGIILVAVSLALMVYVLIERIKEIKSGEEDDLDNY
jgi:Kef-type K+ transport system membrane component KefB